jgi:hypothetical protein
VTIGRPAIPPDEQRLLEATVEAVARAHVDTIDLTALGEPIVGVVQEVYWDGADPSHWIPTSYAITQRKAEHCVAEGCVDDLWLPHELEGMAFDLPYPDLDERPALASACKALHDRVADHAYPYLLERYFLGLARRLHELLGVPVLADDREVNEDLDTQLLSQLTPDERDAWAERGWIELDRPPELHPETVLHVPVGPGQTAGIYRFGSELFGTGHLFPHCGGAGLDHDVTVVGQDPAVVAGLLPRSAVRARVQDLFDAWHEAATADGAWLAVLPHEARGGAPPVEFLAADGSVVGRVDDDPEDNVLGYLHLYANPRQPTPAQVEAALEHEREQRREVLARASVTPLWPAAHPTAPTLRGWEGEHAVTEITLGDDTLEVEVFDGTDDPLDEPDERARDLVEQRLRNELGRRGAGRAVVEAPLQALPATIQGRTETFALIAAGGHWAATWWDPRTELHITVTGTGDPPPSLHLEPARL